MTWFFRGFLIFEKFDSTIPFFKKKLFFIFDCARSSSQHGLFSTCGERLLSIRGVQASHRGGFSCCRAQALGHVGFPSCGVWAP